VTRVADFSDPLESSLSDTHLPINPDSPEALKQIKAWLALCVESHTCAAKDGNYLPSRLLDVSENSNEIRLFSPFSIGIWKSKYIALSYCWGKSEPFTTTSETLQSRPTGFSVEEMPKTLQDAVQVKRALHIQYLWIDALCIIQGSDEKAQKDWKMESGRMESVYGNAFLTIAAAASDSCDGGLFYSRSCALQFLTQPTNVENNFVQTRKSITASIPNPARHVKEEPLNCRAWALQERILSHRILTYTFGGIFFQCAQGGLSTVDGEAKGHHIYKYRFSRLRRYLTSCCEPKCRGPMGSFLLEKEA
jgi:hypothetical protein